MSKSDVISATELNNFRRHGFIQGYLSAVLGKDYIWNANSEDCKIVEKEAIEILKHQDKKLENYLNDN